MRIRRPHTQISSIYGPIHHLIAVPKPRVRRVIYPAILQPILSKNAWSFHARTPKNRIKQKILSQNQINKSSPRKKETTHKQLLTGVESLSLTIGRDALDAADPRCPLKTATPRLMITRGHCGTTSTTSIQIEPGVIPTHTHSHSSTHRYYTKAQGERVFCVVANEANGDARRAGSPSGCNMRAVQCNEGMRAAKQRRALAHCPTDGFMCVCVYLCYEYIVYNGMRRVVIMDVCVHALLNGTKQNKHKTGVYEVQECVKSSHTGVFLFELLYAR